MNFLCFSHQNLTTPVNPDPIRRSITPRPILSWLGKMHLITMQRKLRQSPVYNNCPFSRSSRGGKRPALGRRFARPVVPACVPTAGQSSRGAAPPDIRPRSPAERSGDTRNSRKAVAGMCASQCEDISEVATG